MDWTEAIEPESSQNTGSWQESLREFLNYRWWQGTDQLQGSDGWIGKETDSEIDVFGKIPGHIVWVFPLDVVLIEGERSGCIQVPEENERVRYPELVACLPLETNKVGHGANRKVKDKVHSSGMEGVDELHPFVDCAPMGISDGEIKGRVACQSGVKKHAASKRKKEKKKELRTVGLPYHVQEDCARKIDCLHSHSLDVVKL